MQQLSETLQPCATCNKVAIHVCSHCGEFYCNIKCQRKNWHVHRYICFPRPPMREDRQKGSQDAGSSATSDKLSEDSLNTKREVDITTSASNSDSKNHTEATPKEVADVSCGSKVILLRFRSMNRVYVRVSSPESDQEYMKVLSKVHWHGVSAPRFRGRPAVGDDVITGITVSGANSMVRGKVMTPTEDDKTRIFLSDFGKVVARRANTLRQIAPEIISLPQFLVLVHLRHVTCKPWTAEMCEIYQKQFGDREYTIRYGNVDHAGGTAELYNSEICLNEEVNRFRKQTAKKQQGTKEELSAIEDTNPPLTRVMEPPFKFRPFQRSLKNFEIRVLEDSALGDGYIGAILETDLDNLLAIGAYLDKYNEIDEPYEPVMDEYCIARYDSEWVRARVVAIPNDGSKYYTALNIDFTNEHNVTQADIRRYPSDLTRDCTTNLCKIANLPLNASPRYVQQLRQRIHFEVIAVEKITSQNDEFSVIELTQVLQQSV